MKKNVSTTIRITAAAHCTSTIAPVSSLPATWPPCSSSRAFWIASWTSRSLSPSGAAASPICPAPCWTFSTTSGTWLTNGGMTSPQSPRKTTNASPTASAEASAGGAPLRCSQRASGVSSVASSIAMITGITTTIMRLANSASSTMPPITIATRSVIAEATARPRGTASSPAQRGAGAGLVPPVGARLHGRRRDLQLGHGPRIAARGPRANAARSGQ